MEVPDTSEEVGFRIVGRFRLAEQSFVVCGVLGAIVEYVRGPLLAGDIAELLAHQFIRLLDCMEVVPGSQVLPDVIINVLVNLDLNIVV